MPYTLIDHTADVGIRVEAGMMESLFSSAAEALFDQITDREKLVGDQKVPLSATGSDLPDLMVNWLREVLYLWNGRSLLVKNVGIQSISHRSITTVASCDSYHPHHHTILTEIKAVTYHQIEVGRSPSGWHAQIIFDV